jgi:gliding motility-associated-like protein
MNWKLNSLNPARNPAARKVSTMRRKILMFVLFIALMFSLSAQEDPLTAEFNSSSYDNTAGMVAGSHTRYPYNLPSYLVVNPALYNTLGVPLVEVSYGGIIDLGGSGYSGHRFSGWGNIPLASGQLNTGLEFQYLNTSLAATGSAGRLHLGWANTFRESFLLGLGLETGFAAGGGASDWALNGKLGVSQNLGLIGPFEEFTWHAALTGLGKEMTTPGGTFYRSPFSLRGGISGSVKLSDDLELFSAVDVALPGFTDVMLNARASLAFRERLALSLGWGIDFGQQFSDRYQNASLLPRLSVSYSLLNVEHPDLDSTLAVYSPYANHLGVSVGAALPVQRVDRDGPVIDIDMPDLIYLSPNSDGRQDNWDEAIAVSDESAISLMSIRLLQDGREQFVQSYELEPVREETIYGIVREVLQGVQTVSIPESILISGKNNDGAVLADGRYSLEISAVDILGNTTVINPSEIVIDTAAPEISIAEMSVEDKIFSPNNDGNKDFIRFPQVGSQEVTWELRIFDAQGNLRWSRDLEDYAPESLDWNGHDNNDQRLPDGVYRYQISSRDLAGNENSAEVGNIIINSVVSPVRIELASAHFSPNGDGVKDDIELLPRPESRNGIDRWSIEILDDREQMVVELGGSGAPAASIAFDGTDGAGNTLAQGRYRARFILYYFSGNEPRALSPWFNLDVSAPEISVELSADLLSPNNDQRSDDISIFQEASEENLWSASIIDELGGAVKSYEFRGVPDFELVWDGRNEQGELAPDGSYRYRISSTDQAGNSTSLISSAFALDTSDAEVLVNASLDAFSPNGDQVLELQSFTTRVNNNDQVANYDFRIINSSGDQVRNISGSGPVPESFSWDGRDDDGLLASDGQYRGQITVELNNRSIGEASTRNFVLDTRAPVISADSEYLVFSPNGDGNRDALRITQRGTGEALYEGRLLSADGSLVAEYFWKDRLESFSWDGLDQFGNLAANGIYRYELRVSDSAGNLSEATIANIELDSRNTSVFLTVSDTGISPNGDGFKDELEIGMYTNITDGIERWTLGIYSSDGSLVRELGGNSIEAVRTFIFDGTDEAGNLLSGEFFARFVVNYTKGDVPEATSSSFRVDTRGPVLSRVIAPLPFGPDGDGQADVLSIDVNADDPAGVAGWRFGIYDRVGNLFHEFASQGAPEERLFWDGLADSGERVISAEDYRYEFEAIDNLGNTSLVEGLIPIDILVIRDGDRYKVQISNIVFEPNSPRIVLGGVSDVGVRNQQILERLVQVFDKYPQYRIIIEGHANNVSGTEREEVEELLPLSEGRAQAVKDQMVALGMDPDRIDIIGRGGRFPLVPFSDEENRWKNRRVEFILVR